MIRRRWGSAEAMGASVYPLIVGQPALIVLQPHQSSEPMRALIAAARDCAIPLLLTGNAASAPDAPGTPNAPDAPDAPDAPNAPNAPNARDAPRARPDHEFWIRPRRLSLFFGTELSIILRELRISTLILAGGQTSVGVHYSFVDAHQNDYFTRVVEDCMAGISPPAHEAALRAMEYMQTGARRMSAAVITALGEYRDASRARSKSTA
jgi:nicotinamidase-related amidase